MSTKGSLDPVTFEVLRHRLWQINDEQGTTIRLVSSSPIVTEANDFNVVLTDANGDIVTIGPYVIFHVSTLDIMIKEIMKKYASQMEEEDMWLCNDPWMGAIHQNDVAVLGPVHYKGELVAWFGNTLHQVDVGGIDEGSMCPSAQNVFQEAPLYCMKVVRAGVVAEDVKDVYLKNSRTPGTLELNLRAQIAAINVAKRRLLDTIEHYGVETVKKVMAETISYSERMVKERLLEMPDGEWYTEAYHDHDGLSERYYRLCLTLRKEADHIIFDYTGTDAQAPGFINVVHPTCFGGTTVPLFTFLCGPDIPWNSGVFRCCEVISPEGSIVNAAFPAPVSMGAGSGAWITGCMATIVLSEMFACSEKHKDRANATWLAAINACNVFGKDEKGMPFGTFLADYKGGGGGARSFGDGFDHSGTLCALYSRTPNVEYHEYMLPIIYLYRNRLPDTGGPGKYRGGISMISLITPHGVKELTVTGASMGAHQSNAIGLCGGYPGGGMQWAIVRNSDVWERFQRGKLIDYPEDLKGERELFPSKILSALRYGDVLVFYPHGGGGYGDPIDREPALVLKDVIEGAVTLKYAGEIYGVAIDLEARKLLEAETEELRKRIRAERLSRT